MVKPGRIRLVVVMGAEIIRQSLNAGRLQYNILPSQAIDVGDIVSLRAAGYQIVFPGTSEWLDIEEFTMLSMFVDQWKVMFEFHRLPNFGNIPPSGTIEATLAINPAPTDAAILACACKTMFSTPTQLN